MNCSWAAVPSPLLPLSSLCPAHGVWTAAHALSAKADISASKRALWLLQNASARNSLKCNMCQALPSYRPALPANLPGWSAPSFLMTAAKLADALQLEWLHAGREFHSPCSAFRSPPCTGQRNSTCRPCRGVGRHPDHVSQEKAGWLQGSNAAFGI